MRTTHLGVVGQCAEFLQRCMHLRRRALKQATAPAGEQCIAAEQQGAFGRVCAVVGDVPSGVPRHVQYLQGKTQHLYLLAFREPDGSRCDFFGCRAVDGRPRLLLQSPYATDMIRMVVGD